MGQAHVLENIPRHRAELRQIWQHTSGLVHSGRVADGVGWMIEVHLSLLMLVCLD
jgi:hypothetical protein